jgi:hypothetical protein
MPSRRPCLGPGRFHLSEPGESRCAQHRLTKWASKAGTSMGSGWATLRRRVLTEEPRCRSCGANATTVDHIVARAFAAVTIERTWLRSAPRVTARRPRPTLSRADAAKLPDDWRRFGDRHSPISRSPRSAVTAGGAVVNLLYTLALIESRLALVALGLDPGLGFAHRDGPYREGAAFDLVEALRPSVDRFALDLFATRTFARREFVEAEDGTVRLAPALARGLAGSTLSMWEREVGPVAEEVARIVAASATSAVTVRTRLIPDRSEARPEAGDRCVAEDGVSLSGLWPDRGSRSPGM